MGRRSISIPFRNKTMEATSRANSRGAPTGQHHDNTRFTISDSSLVNLLRMESIQSLRQAQQEGALQHSTLPLLLATHGHDLATLRDYLLPVHTDLLLQGNRSRMLALSGYIATNNNVYDHSRRSSNWVLSSDAATRNSTQSPFLFPPREGVLGPYSLSSSLLDVRRRMSHQLRGEGPPVGFQEPALSAPFRPIYQDTRGRTHELLPASPPLPFHGQQPSSSLDLQLIAAIEAKNNNKIVLDKNETGEDATTNTCGPSVVPSKKHPKLVTEEDSTTKSKSPVSSKPYRKHQSENWKERYAELVEFQKQHGHCLVPNVFKENPPLAEWVKRQRYQYKLKKLGEHNSMSDDRIKMLEKLGFVWNSHDLLWEERLNDLKHYKEVHGDCNVPSKYTPNPSLAIWVKRQRRQYKFMTEAKVSTMTRMRIKKLNEIGFSWAARRATQGSRERHKL